MSSHTTKKIVVEKRGTFHDDSFFKDSWSEWDQAMKDAVDRWDKQTGAETTKRTTTSSMVPASTETKTVYRQMRSSNITSDESQAVSCTEEDDKFKIVMDVKDFSPDDISLKVIDDKIVVEGKIEKKEGNSITTQKFTRRFLLPSGVNMNAIGSALSKDGVLSINVPKLALTSISSKSEKTIPVLRADNTITSRVMGSNYGRPNFIITTGGPPAGKPTHSDSGPFNPTGGGNVTVYESSSKPGRITETVIVNVPDRRNNHVISTNTDNSDNWRSFNTMVEKSQREMENMMNAHTLTSTTQVPPSNTAMVAAPIGVSTTKDVTRSGNTVTEKQEKKWDDTPAPGVVRTNRALQENSEVKDDDGNVIGNKMKMEKESKAEGSREETLPDGTKCKIFTKTYETKKSYTSNLR